MNLRLAAAGVIAAVNPPRMLSVQVSAGYVVSADGTQVPVYRRAVRVSGDVQPLSTKDLQQIDGLNLQGTLRAIYINGNVEGIVRSDNKGGDLITTDDDGKVWLVTSVLEHWTGWCKVSATLQDGA